MEIRDRYQQGASLSAISRETGHDRATIRDSVHAAAPRPADPPARTNRPRLLAPYEEYIRQRAPEGCWNATVLFDAIRAQGYTGGRTMVKDFLPPLRPRAPLVPVTRYETPPGRQAPWDWAKCGETEPPDGTVEALWLFAYTLSYSRGLYLEFVRDTRQDTLLAGREHAFAPFGGVPAQILSDNMTPMVVHPPGVGP